MVHIISYKRLISGSACTFIGSDAQLQVRAKAWNVFAAVIYRYYQYGSSQGDTRLRNSQGSNCDRSGKSCASDFIQIPKVQIFNAGYKRLKVSVWLVYLLCMLQWTVTKPSPMGRGVHSQSSVWMLNAKFNILETEKSVTFRLYYCTEARMDQ